MSKPSDRQVFVALEAFDLVQATNGNLSLATRLEGMRAALIASQPRQAIKSTPACAAVQYSDQMQCGNCGLAWDVNDPEPPQCPATQPKEATK